MKADSPTEPTTTVKDRISVDLQEAGMDISDSTFSIKIGADGQVSVDGIQDHAMKQKIENVLSKYSDELAKSISDISSKTTADDWEKMAKTTADIADKGSLTADEVIDVSNGRGNVTGVKTGLYLVYAKPANSARFGYTFVPYLISAPNNEFAMTGSGSDLFYSGT